MNRWAGHILLILLVSGLCRAALGGGDLLFERLSIEHGLSQSIVNASMQDARGFLWFVTEDGLNRFDGYDFTVYKHDPSDPHSLAHNEIKCVHQDREGILWVGTFYRGLERFDPAVERFSHFSHDPQDPASLSNDIVWAVLEDSKGRLWVGTGGGGLNRLDREAGTFQAFRNDPSDPASLGGDDVRVLFEDRAGALWVGTAGGGLCRFEDEEGTFTCYRHDSSDPASLAGDDVRALIQDREGFLWVGTADGGLNRFDPSTGRFTRFESNPDDPKSLSHPSVLALLIDDEGRLWAGTDGGGLNRYDAGRNAFVRYVHDPLRPESLSGNRVYSLCLDDSGVLWVGTYGNGLSKCDLNKKAFRHFRHDPNDPATLGHDIVWSFCEEPEGVLWIGTHDGGINRMDRAAGIFTRIVHDPADPRSLSHDSVRMVIADRAGTIWAATNGGGLDRLDPRTGVFEHHRHDPAEPGSLSHDQLRMVFEDSEGTIWAGTYGGGLDRWDPEAGVFVHHRSDPDDPHTISNDYVRAAFEDASGALWIGTHGGGLNRLDRETGRFTRYRNDPRDPRSLSNDFVFSIHEDRAGTLWVATYGGGLNRMDRAAGAFTAVRKSDGLADDAIYGILEDDGGRLWLSTNSGLCRYDPASGETVSYTMADGLQSNEFNGGSYYRNGRGEMFFGGINGFNVFHPDAIRSDAYRSPVVLTDFQLFSRSIPVGRLDDGRTLLRSTVDTADRIELTHRDRVASFEFAALDYSSPEKNRYAYTLEGLHEDWIDIGTRRFITFTTLPAGFYTLRIRGTNSDGIWSDREASLELVVHPPWWKTRWAALIYIMLLLCVLAAVVRFVKQRERARGRLVEAELRAQAAELQSRTVEAEARALKVENDRKTQELEEARKLQLSMLPEEVPEHPSFTIAARMRTATEVGGDYYDFHVEGDGTLVVAVGDATGHGTRAGIMVTAIKALFLRMCSEPDLAVFFAECNRMLHAIGRNRIFMALCILRIKDLQAVAMGAAVPPLFVYRKAAGKVETVVLRGMFLGTPLGIPQERAAFSLSPGDKVLIFSDGLSDQFNADNMQPEIEACRRDFEAMADREPEAIIDALIERLDEWRGSVPQSDDVTLVVLEAKAT